jgi:hypothetical protein
MAYINIHDRAQLRLAFEKLKEAKKDPRKEERWLAVSYVINEVMNCTTVDALLDKRIWNLAFSILKRNRPLRFLVAAEWRLDPMYLGSLGLGHDVAPF